ncbi:hypothetical protein K1719_023982 [Acacia pycnantha]|nr:hypothetical protein K1719_023982 [Acacia pycnantha]
MTISPARYSPATWSSQSDNVSFSQLTSGIIESIYSAGYKSLNWLLSMDVNREEIGAGGLLFDLNILPSHSQEISENEHDSIEQQIDEGLIQASETNGNHLEEVIEYLSMHFLQVSGSREVNVILKNSVDSLAAEVFESLIRTYAASSKTSSIMQKRLKMENVDLSEDSKKLLDAISVE